MTTADFFDKVRVRSYYDGEGFPVEQPDKIVHQFVIFEFEDRLLLIGYDGFLFDCKSGEEIKTTKAKNGIYEKFTINGVQVYAHHLVLLTCKFKIGKVGINYKVYRNLKAEDNLVVNHTYTIADERGRLIPRKDTSKNALYLELISNKENIWHGHFIKKWDLYNLPLTYKECIFLESFFLASGYIKEKDKKIARDWAYKLAKDMIIK